MKPKRIKLPLDLDAGDIIIDNHGVKHIVSGPCDGFIYGCFIGLPRRNTIFCIDGRRWLNELGYAVAIKRKHKSKRDRLLERLRRFNPGWHPNSAGGKEWQKLRRALETHLEAK